jgi:hypothetical protein
MYLLYLVLAWSVVTFKSSLVQELVVLVVLLWVKLVILLHLLLVVLFPSLEVPPPLVLGELYHCLVVQANPNKEGPYHSVVVPLLMVWVALLFLFPDLVPLVLVVLWLCSPLVLTVTVVIW